MIADWRGTLPRDERADCDSDKNGVVRASQVGLSFNLKVTSNRQADEHEINIRGNLGLLPPPGAVFPRYVARAGMESLLERCTFSVICAIPAKLGSTRAPQDVPCSHFPRKVNLIDRTEHD